MVVRINDFSMNYRDEGSGKPVLLIHGYPLNSKIWEPQLQGLSNTARIIAPDLRGFGESEAVDGKYPMDTLAHDCAKLLDELGVDGPVLVGGLSMGGYVAFAFYRLFRERTAGLILAATRPGADSAEAKANRDKSIELTRNGGAPAVASTMLPKILSPKTYDANPSLVARVRQIMEESSQTGIIGALQGMRDRSDSTLLLQQIKCPTLIFHGADDQIIPVNEAEAMQKAIAGSQLEVLPKSGHLLNMEQPEMFNSKLRDFIDRVIL